LYLLAFSIDEPETANTPPLNDSPPKKKQSSNYKKKERKRQHQKFHINALIAREIEIPAMTSGY
jgi:hypothetical protein